MTTEYGNLLEACVANSLKRFFKVRRSNRKGGRGSPTASDMTADKLQIECKRRSNDSPSITRQWWKKVCKRAGLTGKFPVVVTAGESVNEAIIHMKMRDLVSILDELKEQSRRPWPTIHRMMIGRNLHD